MSFGDAPTPPSPQQGIAAGQQVAGQQQQYNIGAQAGSNYNQVNPYGSINYTQTGTGPNGVPIYSANVTASPQQQQLIDLLTGNKGVTQQQAGSLLFGANYGGQTPQQAVGNMQSGLEGQMMQAYQMGVQPIQQTQRAQVDTQLRNQGLQPGEPGYDNAMRSYDMNVNQANNIAAANYANQAFGQAETLYQQPLSMAAQEMQLGSPTLPTSQAVTGAALQPANLVGAVNTEQQALQNQYNAEMQQYSGMMNGLFGIGGAALNAFLPGAGSIFSALGPAISGAGSSNYNPYGGATYGNYANYGNIMTPSGFSVAGA